MTKPLYQIIVDDLKRDIDNAIYQANDRLPTELELSETYQVSRITSKRALTELENAGLIFRKRGKGSFVKEREQKVTSSHVPNNILLVYPFLSGEITGLGDYTQGILESLEGTDFELLVQTENFLQNSSIEELTTKFAGIIYYPKSSIDSLDVLYQLHLNNLPIIILDKFFHGLPFSAVSADNLLGGQLATKHLIEQGHQKIAFGSSKREMNASSVRDRYLGYLNTLHEAGINESFHLVQKKEHSKEAFLEQIKEQVLQEKITAIVMENDVLAIQLINYLKARDIAIPSQVAIVGFDNIQAASLSYPTLTTIEQNFVDIGRVACGVVLNALTTKEEVPQHQTIPVRLVVRNSSCLNEPNG